MANSNTGIIIRLTFLKTFELFHLLTHSIFIHFLHLYNILKDFSKLNSFSFLFMIIFITNIYLNFLCFIFSIINNIQTNNIKLTLVILELF